MKSTKMKSLGLSLVGVVGFVGMTQQAEAMPMFAKQTGLDCTACHMQSTPKLNKFGRKFVASGMTISKKVSTTDTDINPSVLIKTKYEKTWDLPDGQGVVQTDGTNDGELSVVKAATLSIGGRVAEKVGAIVRFEFKSGDEGSAVTGKAVYANPIEGGYWGVAAYTTHTQGPFAGMEPYNTGLYKPLRNFDMHKYTNANQITKLGSRSATGVQLYFDKDAMFNENDHFYVTAGLYTPAQDNADIKVGGVVIPFARIAYEYMIGDYNVILGGFIINGGKTVGATESLSLKRETYGMDLQIEGTLFDRQATLIMTNVFKNKLEFTGVGAGATTVLEDLYGESFSIEGDISITPDIGLKMGYMTHNDRMDYTNLAKVNAKDIDYALSLGLDYSFVALDTDMKLAVEYAWMKPSLDRVADYRAFMTTLTIAF